MEICPTHQPSTQFLEKLCTFKEALSEKIDFIKNSLPLGLEIFFPLKYYFPNKTKIKTKKTS